MSLGRLLPVDARAGEGRGLRDRGGAWEGREEAAAAGAEGEALERVPEVEGEGVERAAPANQRHGLVGWIGGSSW
uniref:Uncharacterized protein n=1 Tax=Arundo donax TaxID=35708 RepID=A0A0A9BP14_ARUDO